MSDFVISCCSTADMPLSFFQENKIPFASFHFDMDGKTYDDDCGQSMPFKEFYERIAAGAAPVTSQVNPEEYQKIFEPILESGKDILHITLSSGISGTYNSACIARDQMEEEYPGRKVVIVDSLGASSGYGLLVAKAQKLREEGKSLEETRVWLEENKLKLHHWFFSTDLTSYYRGGRISKTSAIFGTALHICPLLNMDNEGRLIPRTKHRGMKKVVEEIVKQMEEHAADGLDYSGRCYISNSACYEYARMTADLVEEKFPNLQEPVMINSVGTVIGAHTGPGTVALFFWGDERTK